VKHLRSAWRHLRQEPLPWSRRISRLLNRRFHKDHRFFRQFPPIPYRVILDVGAHRGEFTRRILRYYSTATVHLVEADPELAQALQRQFADDERCRVIHAAITDVSGPVQLRVNEHRASSSLLRILPAASDLFGRSLREEKSLTVPGLALDELFRQSDLRNVDLMKVDIQGGERGLLRGGNEALGRTRAIYLEMLFQDQYENAALFDELHALLEHAGFRLQFLDDFRRGKNGDLLYCNACYFRPGEAPEVHGKRTPSIY
jgi:FkbM family methyltransferase